MTYEIDPRTQSDLERAFITQFRALGQDLPEPKPQFLFAKNIGRNFEFDFAFPDFRVAVELEGIYTRSVVKCHECGTQVRFRKKDGSLGAKIRLPGYHQRYGRFKTDKTKYNIAVKLGWYVLRFLHDDVHGEPFEMVDTIRQVLYRRRYLVPRDIEMTDRQMEVLKLIAAGFNGPEIAEKLGIAQSTVRNHVQDLRQLTLTRTQAACVARAICWGILDLAEIPWPEDAPEVYDLLGRPLQ